MKSITTSVYTFEKLIAEDNLYIDKTESIYSLVEKSGQYFISRPRRFGKSLLISTIQAIFEGKKELFQGFNIYNKEFEWKQYPVLHFNFSNCSIRNASELKDYLKEELYKKAEKYNVTLGSKTIPGKFTELIEQVAKIDKVVILIDEYDKPILDNISCKSNDVEEIREYLSDFYAVIKAKEAEQRFALLSGVCNFSKASVFSKLNNLTDLSMAPGYATLLGYTEEEVEHYFSEHILKIASREKISSGELMQMLKFWYNGYRFCSHAEKVFSPVSIEKFFENEGVFVNYWFSTGTPSFLIKLASLQQFDLEKALSKPVHNLSFESLEVHNFKILPLLYQTGYLTIKRCKRTRMGTFYNLGFPNFEVESAFNAYLLEEYANIDKAEVGLAVYEMLESLESANMNEFMANLKSLFVNVKADDALNFPRYFQTIFYVIFKQLGLNVKVDIETSESNISVVINTYSHIFLMEINIDGNKDEAMLKIKDNKLFEKHLPSGESIFLMGANFNTEKCTIDDWCSERLYYYTITKSGTEAQIESLTFS